MKKVVHILTHLGGGVGQVLTNIAAQTKNTGEYTHEFLCLDAISAQSKKLIEEKKISARSQVSYEEILGACVDADIVQIDWWNHPLINKFLSLTELPPARLVVYSHISGFHPPLTFTREIIQFADIFCFSTPYSYEHELIRNMTSAERDEKIRVIFIAGGSTDRVKNIEYLKHDGFNVTYVGTVDYCKIHSEFIPMSANVKVPGVKFVVCGGEMQNAFAAEAKVLGKEQCFDFRGFVDDIKDVFQKSDVFGYPLCREHYGTGEQALLEAMAAGVVPVVFANGAEKHIVKNNETGILVETPEEYTAAIELLYHHPKERMRLGLNARLYAEEHFTVKKTANNFCLLYNELLDRPKHNRSYIKRYSGSKSLHPSSKLLGTNVFLNSLGEFGNDFNISIDSLDVKSLFLADQKIANFSGMKAKTRGSVFHYLALFPKDCYLFFWCGLILQSSGDHRAAVDHFQNAILAGFEHWRIYSYIHRCALALDDNELVKFSLNKMSNEAPK